MTITSEDAANSMISDEIENESVTDAVASARTIVVSVDDENATNNQPCVPDQDEEPQDAPPSTTPGQDQPDSDEEE